MLIIFIQLGLFNLESRSFVVLANSKSAAKSALKKVYLFRKTMSVFSVRAQNQATGTVFKKNVTWMTTF